MNFFTTGIFILLISKSLSFKDPGNEIASLIRTGNAKELADFFGITVGLTISGKEEIYSKAQAEQVLRDFFLKNPPKSFVLSPTVDGFTTSNHGIGSYVSRQNKSFTIYFLLKKTGNQALIQQLSIEPQN